MLSRVPMVLPKECFVCRCIVFGMHYFPGFLLKGRQKGRMLRAGIQGKLSEVGKCCSSSQRCLHELSRFS